MANPRLRVLSSSAGLLAACGLLAAWAPAAAAVEVRGIHLETAGGPGAQLTLDLSAPSDRKLFTLENPARVVIDLPESRLAKGLRLPAGQGVVQSVRSGAQPGNTLRLVLQLESRQAPRSQLDTDAKGAHLTIFMGRPGAAKPAVASTAAEPVVPAAELALPESAEPVERAAAAQPVTARQPRPVVPGARDIIVAIDAGHGGTDPGAIGRAGTHEKDITLAIARALARRVDAEPGMKAYLTRDSDHFVVLRDRIVRARNAHADLFVSVHADSVANPGVAGSSVYVLSDRGATNEAARWLAERENAADLKGGVKLADKGGNLASLLLDLTQTASIGSSMEAAERVLTHLDRVGEVHKSQVQQAGFVVLKSPDIPSMLVETAYISNPGEEAKLRSVEHQEAVASAIFSGLRDYFRRNPPDGTLFAQQKGRGSMIAGNTR
ncbi:MAG: hypothetical protein RLZZ393_1274 [Pseudomonadota bacterium]